MKASAWLLTLNGGYRVAVGERELIHIMSDEVERIVVPGATERASAFIVWQNRRVPLFDVAAALRDGNLASGPTTVAANNGGSIIAIAAYQLSNTSQVEFGALPVRGLPERIEVTDDSSCDLPPDSAGWRGLAHSCFKHQQHGAVPILNLGRVFATDANRSDQIEGSRH